MGSVMDFRLETLHALEITWPNYELYTFSAMTPILMVIFYKF
jgi:hypothetical protein